MFHVYSSKGTIQWSKEKTKGLDHQQKGFSNMCLWHDNNRTASNRTLLHSVWCGNEHWELTFIEKTTSKHANESCCSNHRLDDATLQLNYLFEKRLIGKEKNVAKVIRNVARHFFERFIDNCLTEKIGIIASSWGWLLIMLLILKKKWKKVGILHLFWDSYHLKKAANASQGLFWKSS